jgi:putative DNA primase/helicase
MRLITTRGRPRIRAAYSDRAGGPLPTTNDLAQALNLRRVGNQWRGDCPACEYTDSFVLTETRDRKPLWWCAACCDREALTAALGCERHMLPPTAAANAPERPSQAQREAWARKQWERTLPAAGTIVETYLASRGLGSVAPPALRFMPALRHHETAHLGPAMLAAVRDVAGTIRAVHRTWLRSDGSGKADVEPPRKTLGNPGGCAVRLAVADDALVVAEGIETALAAGLLFDLPAWACLSAGGLEAVALPTSVCRVLVAADHDLSGTGQRAAQALAQRLAAEGRRVRISTPDRPGDDFNDVLLRERPNA